MQIKSIMCAGGDMGEESQGQPKRADGEFSRARAVDALSRQLEHSSDQIESSEVDQRDPQERVKKETEAKDIELNQRQS